MDALLKTSVASSEGINGPASRLKVRARLLSAGTQGIVWSQDFEKPRGDSAALANAIAVAVTRAVNGIMTPAETARLTSGHQTNPEAEEAFLVGRSRIEGYQAATAEAALKAFQRALELDPSHARAHAGAARAYVRLWATMDVCPTRRRVPTALGEVQQSLDLDPDLADAHAVLAYILFAFDWDWPGSEREFKLSLDLNPNSAYALRYYGQLLAAQARFDESLSIAKTPGGWTRSQASAVRDHALFLYYKRDLAGSGEGSSGVCCPGNEPASATASSRAICGGARGLQWRTGRHPPGTPAFRWRYVPLKVQEIRLQALAGQKDGARASLAVLQREADAAKVGSDRRTWPTFSWRSATKRRRLTLFDEAVTTRDPHGRLARCRSSGGRSPRRPAFSRDAEDDWAAHAAWRGTLIVLRLQRIFPVPVLDQSPPLT